MDLQSQRIAHAVEGIVDLFAKYGENCNHQNGNEGDNNRVLNQPLAFLFENE